MEVSNAESFVKLKRRFPYRSIVIAFGDVAPELEQCLVARSAQNPFGVRPAAVGDLPVERPGPAGRRKGIEARLGPNSTEKFWLEFRLEKSLEFWLEIPYTKEMFKNG